MTRSNSYVSLFVMFLIFIACAGPGRVHQSPSEIIVPPPEFVVQDEDDLSLDQITLADSLLVQQSPVRILQEARHRYNTAITSLAEADTTSARTAIDEVLRVATLLFGWLQHGIFFALSLARISLNSGNSYFQIITLGSRSHECRRAAYQCHHRPPML